jgi:hypothetical protein
LGAYDVEANDVPQISIQEPTGGNLSIFDNKTAIPTIIDPCINRTLRTVSILKYVSHS